MPEYLIVGALICGVIVFLVILIAIMLLPITLYRTLSAVHPDNRTMAPGLVFLILIPMFHLIWFFFIVLKMSSSLQQEFSARDWNTRTLLFNKITGIILAIISVTGLVLLPTAIYLLIQLSIDVEKPAKISFNIVAFLFLVFYIVYWVQIGRYGGKLRRSLDERHRPKRGYDFDEYERKRRRRQRKDEDEDEVDED